ncbi:MAG: transporter substrate-binding domain-containing protein [Methylocapsa sp.]|nr:transporter substrate-binding domain-containing protein [Methylocapsa sp.]
MRRISIDPVTKHKICSAGLFTLLAVIGQPAHPASAGFVPSFWEPQSHLVKPSLEGLRSIRFLTEDDYPPFHFALPDGRLSGFDVDLARAICDELGISCTIQARRFDTLIDALNGDQGDAIMAAIRIDPQSRAKLDFTGPYYSTPARFVSAAALETAPATPERLRGKTVGVQAQSAHEAYLSAYFPETMRKAYQSQEQLREALASGAIDTIFGDGISLSLWLESPAGQQCCRFRGGPYLGSGFFGEGVGIAVKKGNWQLRQTLDYALTSLAKKGTYANLYLKYFPIGFY